MMGDLIDRQALLQALCNEDGAQHEYCYPCKTVLDVVNAQPSAQPEPIKINIEDFNKEDWERLKKEWGNTPITVLSAQPEIIRCKNCKFWTHIKRTKRYWCKTDDGLYDLNTSADDFCSRAERRTDATD